MFALALLLLMLLAAAAVAQAPPCAGSPTSFVPCEPPAFQAPFWRHFSMLFWSGSCERCVRACVCAADATAHARSTGTLRNATDMEFISRHHVVGLDWTVDLEALPLAHRAQTLAKQAASVRQAAISASRPPPLVFVYRQAKKALSIFDRSARAMQDPASAAAFLQWPNGTLFDEPLQVGRGRVMHQYIYNFTEPIARDLLYSLLVDDIVDDPNVAGIFVDGLEKDDIFTAPVPTDARTNESTDERTDESTNESTDERADEDALGLGGAPHPAVSAAEARAIAAAQHAVLRNASAALFARRRFVWQSYAPLALPAPGGPAAACAAELARLAGVCAAAAVAAPGLYTGHCVGRAAACPHLGAQLAAFLVARGPYSLFFANDAPPYYAPLDADYGAPLAAAQRLNATAFRREYANARVEFDCDGYVGRVEWRT